MAQIQKGDTFTNGQQVDATRLNQLLDSSALLVGAISEQTTMTPNTVESTDQTIINDGGVLKKTTVGSLLNSNLPISTSSITGGAGVDIILTPASGREVDIAGNFQVIGNNTTTGNSTVGGTLTVTGNTTLTGNATASGNLNVGGNLTYGGNIPQKQIGFAFLTRELTPNLQYFLTPAGTWNDLPFNTIAQLNPFVVNSASFTGVLSSVGTGTLTLPAGTYIIDAELSIQSQGGGAEMTLRLFNQTTTSVIKNGRQTTCNSYVNSRALVSALITLTVQTDVKVQYYTNAVANTNYGATMIGAPAPTLSEVVCTAKIMKLA